MTAGRSLYLYVFLSLFACSVSHAQTSDIHGVVVDSVTRQRIPFAVILLQGTNRGTTANADGFFLIPKLEAGSYNVAANVIGYVKKVQKVNLGEGKAVESNFELAPEPVQSQAVLITAPRNRPGLENVPSVQVLGKEQLKAVPVAAQQDLLQSIKILPGIVSTSDVSSRFFVRGGAGDQNMFMFDGLRVYSPFHALGIFSIFDPDIVDNVEVFTGAFPAGYGGALSSVVNISSREGRADRISARAGANFLSATAAIEGPAFSGSSYLINARKSMFPHSFSTIFGQNAPLDFYDVTAKFSMQPAGVQKFDVTYLTSRDVMNFSSPTDPNYSWRNDGVSISSSALPIDRLYVHWLLYGSNYAANRDGKGSSAITSTSTSVREVGLRLLSTYYTTPPNLYFIGFDFRFPNLNYSFVNRLGVPLQLADSWPEISAWAQYQMALEDFQFNIGLNLEAGSLLESGDAKDEIQPRVSASYLMFGNWKLKAAYGRVTQRMLTVNNEDDVISLFDAWIHVPTDLPPEQADHYVLGAEGNVTDETSVNVETYYKHYGSLVLYNQDKVSATDPDYIQGKGESYGLEMMIRSRISVIELYAAYSLAWARLNNQGFEYYPRYDRRHHLNLMAVTRLFDGLTTSLKWEYGSGFPFTQTIGYFDELHFANALPGSFETETGSPIVMLGAKNAARLPAYHRLDLDLSYDFSVAGLSMVAGFDILNLYDNKNIFYFDRTTGQRVNMISFYPSASLSIRY